MGASNDPLAPVPPGPDRSDRPIKGNPHTMSTVIRAFALSTIGTLLCSCATESIQVRVMRPAPVNLGQYDLIAVESFNGNGGDELADELTTALASTRNPLTGSVDFEVLDRRDVDRMLDDLRRRQGTDWNEDAMALLE